MEGEISVKIQERKMRQQNKVDKSTEPAKNIDVAKGSVKETTALLPRKPSVKGNDE